MNASNLRLVAIRSLETAVDNADTVLETAGDTLDTVTNDNSSLGDKVMDVLTNKFVIGGAAAVVVAGAAYGVFRWLKKDDKPAAKPAAAPATPAAPAAPEMTTEQMIDKARELLTSAETRLKDTKKEGTAAQAAAA
jgi:hypothetical protein